VEHDSRDCTEGTLFVAVDGFHTDGHRHARDAVAAGAVAVVAEREPRPRLPRGIPLVVVPDSRPALSALSAAIAGDPSAHMRVVGVTGTDGKTTTTTMTWAAWRAAELAAAAMTTVDWRERDLVSDNAARQTTLEADALQRRLADLRDAGITHMALEVSSHGLELRRVDHVAFEVAVFTRVTSEHLELHGSLDAYLAAKARLLERVAERSDGVAVLDADDDFATPRLASLPVARRLTYSATGRPGSDVVAAAVRAAVNGARFRVESPWGAAEVELQVAGRFNVANALAAITAACMTGATLDAAAAGVAALPPIRGRMERIALGQPFDVVVDYAHTAHALETVLGELRSSTPGRLWALFGSAGERDVEKRTAMGAVAARLADVVVITDEDPRDEDRHVILEQIAAGATAAGGMRGDTVVVIPDRTEAIQFAVSHARPGDTVLCAGKGHERSIINHDVARPWDEHAVAAAAVRDWLAAGAGTGRRDAAGTPAE